MFFIDYIYIMYHIKNNLIMYIYKESYNELYLFIIIFTISYIDFFLDCKT